MKSNFSAWPIALILFVITLPIIIMYGSLVIDTVTYTPPEALFPTEFTLKDWRFLIDPTITGNVWEATWNSFFLGIVMIIVVLPLSATGGYALSRLVLPFRSYLLGGLLVIHALPSVTLLIGIFFVLNFSGLYNTVLGLILVKASLSLPFGIWITKGFYDAVPWEIEMAGIQDGASRFTVWRRLVLPQVIPGLIALSVFAFLDGWGEFLMARIFVPGANFQVLSVFLKDVSQPDSVGYDFSLFKSVGLFYTLPVLALYAIFQNRLMNIFNGGTKG